MATQQGGKGRPLVAATGQAWKVTAGIGGMVLAAIASIAWYLAPDEVRAPIIALGVATGVLGIAALASVRCPRCGRSLGAWAFRTGSLTTWHEALVEVAACPYCGLSAEERGGGRGPQSGRSDRGRQR